MLITLTVLYMHNVNCVNAQERLLKSTITLQDVQLNFHEIIVLLTCIQI